MTKLTDQQEDLLDRVKNEQTAFLDQSDKLRRAYERELEDAKEFLVEAVVAAIAGGVPKRRVHIDGLGTKDSKTLTDLLADQDTGPAAKKAQRPAGLRMVQDNIWLATAKDGKTYEFFVVDIGDTVVVEQSGITDEGAATFDVRPSADVFQMIEKEWQGRADLSEFFEDSEEDDSV